jgi:gas vesicle protein
MAKVVTGFLAGVALGAVAGLLMAPDKGSKTRKKIMQKADDMTCSIKDKFSSLFDDLKSRYSDLKGDAETFGNKATNTMSGAKKDTRDAFTS